MVGDIRLKAYGDITVTEIEAGLGNIAILTDIGQIIDGGDAVVDLSGDTVLINAVGSVGTLGTLGNAIETSVNIISVITSQQGINIAQAESLVLGSQASATVVRASNKLDFTDIVESQEGVQVLVGGDVIITTLTGDLTLTQGSLIGVEWVIYYCKPAGH